MGERKTDTVQASNTQLAIAILAVSNIKVSLFGLDLLKQREEGKISFDEARESVRAYAQRMAQ